MSFTQIIGHEIPIDILQRAISGRRLPTGYLFAGPQNVGKTRIALELAKAINCQNPTEAADCCDECEACRRIDENSYPYLRIVFPMLRKQEELRQKQVKRQQEGEEPDEVLEQIEVEGAEILIDPVREMLRSANLKAPEGVWKIYLIRSAEKLRYEAANRLLKTLEEPPPQTTFILTTSRPAEVLPTIASRCQVIDFGPVPRAPALAALREEFGDSDPQEVTALAAASAGRYGWARRMLGRPPMLANRRALLKLLAELPSYELYEGMRIAEELIELAEAWFTDSYEPDSPEAETAAALLKSSRDQILRTVMVQLLDVMLTWWRDIALLIGAPGSEKVMNCDYLADLTGQAAIYGAGDCRRALRWIEESRGHFLANANLRLAAELLMLKLISLAPAKP